MQSFTRWLVVLLGLTLGLSALAAGDPNEKAIKARKAVMTLQSWYAGPLFGMAKGDIEYDADMASANAAHLDMMANVEGGAMWPQGTDNGAYEGMTRALPEIWTTWPAVGEKDQALKDAAAALAEVAGDGLDALRSKIGAVGKACKGCHDDFRAEKN